MYLTPCNRALRYLREAIHARQMLSVSWRRVPDMAACRSDSGVVYGGLSVESVAVALASPVPEISGQLKMVRLRCTLCGLLALHAFLGR